MGRTRRTPARVRRFIEDYNESTLRKLREDRLWSRRRREAALRAERGRVGYLRWKIDKDY